MTIFIPPFQFLRYRLICFFIFTLVISRSQAQFNRLTDIASGSANSNPAGFFLSPSEDYLYFYASTAANNSDPEWFRLKLSDNTVEQLTTDFAAGNGTIIGSAFRSGNNVFFAGKKTGALIQWGRLNLTDGTFSHFNISSGTGDANPNGGIATDANNNVYAIAGDGSYQQVFKWTQSTNTAAKISTFTTPAISGNGGIAHYNGYLYFQISTVTGACPGCTSSDNELVRYKLSDNSFSRYDVNPGTDGSSPQDIQLFGNKLFFTAFNNSNRQVFTLDLSNVNSTPVKLTNFTATSTQGDVGGFLYDGSGKVYFYADGEADTQRNIYVADLSANTATKLTGITTNNTFIGIRTIYDGHLYYTQHITPAGSNASFNKLKLSDKSITSLTTTPQLVGAFLTNTTASIAPSAVVIGTKLYFQGNSADHGTEVWQCDLATDAVTRLSDINPGTGLAAPAIFKELPNNQFIFRANDGSTGVELYRYTPPAPTPIISASGTLSAVSTTYGTASSTTNFSVSGANMTQGITVTPPSGFEVSLSSGSGYNTFITAGAAGTISATTIYVRLAANTAPGNYSGNVALSSSGATGVNVATVSSTVNAKPLTVTGLTGANKTYDALSNASVTGTATLSGGLVGSDAVTLSGPGTFNFAGPAIGNNKPITASGFTLTGAQATRYTLSQPANLSANIIAKGVTITGITANNKVYDGTTTATLTGTATLNGVVNTDNGNVTLGGTPNVNFNDPGVGNNKPVTVTGYTISGSASSNYSLSQPSGLQANITPADPIITSFQPTSGDVNQLVTISGSNFLSATAVTIGGVAAKSFNVVDNNTITATTNDNFTTGYITITKGTTATSATQFTRTPSCALIISNTVAVPVASVTDQPTCPTPTGTITVTYPTGADIRYSADGTTFQASPVLAGLTANATYTVTAKDNSTGCYTTLSNLMVNAVPAGPTAPTGNASQTFCAGATVANLIATGASVKWYDASTLGNLLATTTVLTNGTVYYASQTVSNCESSGRLTVTATVNPVSVGGNISGSANVCTGTNSTALTLSSQIGNVLKWQSSLTSDFATANDINNTTTSLTATNLTQTTYYRAVVQSGICAPANSANATVTVDPVSVGGSVSSIQTICQGFSPADLNLTGNTGSVIKWQKSSDAAFTTPVDINVTSTTLTGATIGNLTADTWFRAVVQNGVCAAANSASVKITVNATSIGGSVSSTQTICQGFSPADLNLTGNTGSVIKWQRSADAAFTTPVDINVTSTTLTGATIGNLTADTWFRAVVQNGVCAAANSASVKITVNATSIGGSVSNIQIICQGFSPADLTLSGNTGNVTKWQKSSDAAFTTPVDINVTSTTLTGATIGNLTADTWFRAVVQNGVCAATNSASVKITVNATSVGGTVSSIQTICQGFSPADLTLAGNIGNVTKWQKSSDAAFTTPVDIAVTSTTLTSGNIGNLTADTWFRAVVQNGVCAAANSASVKITVNATSIGGTVSSIQTICQGFSPADLTLIGNTGNVTKWQKSSDAAFTTPVDINVTSTTLPGATIGNLTADTWFRAVVQNGVCAAANSASVKITVNATSVGGTVSSIQTICSGFSPADLTLSGNTGSVTKWQRSADAAFTTPVDINVTSTTLTSANIGTLTADTWFRAVVQNGVCAATNSASVKITVTPTSVGGNVSSAQTICQGFSPADITLSGNTGSVTKWQKSSDAAFTTPVDINSTSTTLTSATIGNLTADTWFRAVVQNGVCAATNSASVKITVNATSVGGTVSSIQTICSGFSPADLTLSGNTGSVTKWQKSSDAAFTAPIDINSTSTTLTGATIGNLTADTWFRAVVQNGVCATTNSATVKITVNANPVVSAPAVVCVGSIIHLSPATGGTWISNDPTKATVTNYGTVTGVAAGSVTFTFTATATGCSSTTSGVTVNALPVLFTLTGGGSYCQAGSGLPVGLADSEPGISYQLLRDGNTAGTAIAGSGEAITFGAQTVAGTYTVRATNTATNCTVIMTGSAVIGIYSIPTATISGTNTVCQSSPPPPVTFTAGNGTAPYTFTYKINAGGALTAATVSGNSVEVAASTTTATTLTYTLLSVQDSHGCSQSQSGSALITVSPLPNATITYPGSPFKNIGTASVSLTGTPGGTFSATGGLVISASTGQIDLANSPTGTYTVTYTIAPAGGCAQFQTTALVIIGVKVLYVNAANVNPTQDGTTWAKAFANLKTALSVAALSTSDTVEVWVAQGTYKPGTLRKDVFEIPSGVRLYGGFTGGETDVNARNWKTNLTVLSGEIGTTALNDNSQHVVLFRATNPLTRLDGFRIEKGYAEFYAGNQNSDLNDPNLLSSGGGVLAIDKSRGLITNCVLTDNRATSGGAMMLMDSSALKMTKTIVWGNEANFGGGIYVIGGSKPVVENVLVVANKGLGGGLYVNQSQLTLNNCTVASNQGNGSAGGIFNTNGVTIVKNSILWGNTSPQSTVESVISYSIVEGGYPGVGNQSLNPLFVDPNSVGLVPLGSLGDYHLQACSPAINAGDNANAPAIDLDGNARPFPAGLGIVDMGVYESQSTGSSGPNHVTVTESITSGTVLKVGGFISATNQVSNATVVYQATHSVTLSPGFSAVGNSFQAVIGGCGTN